MRLVRPKLDAPPAAPRSTAPAVVLHRRRQQVIVRSSGAPAPPPSWERRRELATLPGLGARPTLDTIPPPDEIPPVSEVRARVAPRTRPRAERLLDDVHDELARHYREQAELLVASGIFDRDYSQQRTPRL